MGVRPQVRLNRVLPSLVCGFYYGLALCMNGRKDRAILDITDLMNGVGISALYRSQLIGALVFIHLLSGELAEARKQAQSLEMLTHRNHIAHQRETQILSVPNAI